MALLQGEAGEVKEEVKEAVDILGMGVQEECGLVTGATLEEDLLSYWEDDPENIVKSKEATKFVNKSLDKSKDGGEYNVFKKVRDTSSDQSMGVKEGCSSFVKGATLKEKLPSELEHGPETTHKMMKHTKCKDRAQSSSSFRILPWERLAWKY